MTILICGAFPPEIQDLKKTMAGDVLVAPLGVGLVNTAATLGQILERHPISCVLFTGTCGALPSSSLTIGDCVRAKTIYLGDLASLTRDAFFPEIMPTTITPTRFLDAPKSLPEMDVFCPLTITQSEAGAGLLQKKFPDGVVENLECFAVAQIAVQRNLPFEAVLGVSNFIGPNGHTEWCTHHTSVSHITQRLIQKFIE